MVPLARHSIRAVHDDDLEAVLHGLGILGELKAGIVDCLAADNAFYRPITVGPALAPPDTSKARIKIIADIRADDPPSPVYFDEINLTSSMEPSGYFPLLLKNYAR